MGEVSEVIGRNGETVLDVRRLANYYLQKDHRLKHILDRSGIYFADWINDFVGFYFLTAAKANDGFHDLKLSTRVYRLVRWYTYNIARQSMGHKKKLEHIFYEHVRHEPEGVEDDTAQIDREDELGRMKSVEEWASLLKDVRYRKLVIMYYRDGMTLKEIGKKLKLGKSNTSYHLSVAIRELRYHATGEIESIKGFRRTRNRSRADGRADGRADNDTGGCETRDRD